MLATKQKIEEQEREINLQTASVATVPQPTIMPPDALINPLPLASTNLGPSRSFINTSSTVVPQVIYFNILIQFIFFLLTIYVYFI